MSHFYRKHEKYRNQERDTHKEKFHKKRQRKVFIRSNLMLVFL